MMERDEHWSKRIIFSDEAIIHLSRKVNRHSIWIWGSEKPVPVVEVECGSPKVNMFGAVYRRRLFGLFFVEKSGMRQVCLKMLTRLVNATKNIRGVHFPTRRCPTTLACGCPGVPH
jgi:hypothetical protein